MQKNLKHFEIKMDKLNVDLTHSVLLLIAFNLRRFESF